MKKNAGLKLGFMILGVILVIVGSYQVYRSLIGSQDSNEETQSSEVSIGETISDKDGVEFCVTSAEDTKSIGDLVTGNNYIVLTVKINNQSKESYDVNSLRFILMNGDVEYEYCEDAVLSVDEQMYLDTINPELSQEYKIVYETPCVIKDGDWKLKILHNTFSEEDSVYININ